MGKFVTRGHHAQRIEKVMLSRKAKAERRGQKKSIAGSLGKPQVKRADKGTEKRSAKSAEKSAEKTAEKTAEKGPDAPAT